MKDSKIYAKKIAKLYRDMKKEYGKVKPIKYDDPIEAVVFGILCQYLTLPAARSALRKIRKHFVDLNDLRVSRDEEVIEVLGKNGEDIKTIAREMSESLNAIFYKFDTISLNSLREEGKRQAKKELEDLGKITQFAISYCFLTALSGHAIPISQSMSDYLRVEELVHPKAKLADIEGFLERQNKSDEAYEFFMLLKTHSDAAAKKTAKKLAKIAAEEEAKKPAKKPGKKTSTKTKAKEEKPAKKKAAKKPAKKTEKKSVKKAAKKTPKKTAKKTVKKAAKKTTKKTAKKKAKKAAKKNTKSKK